jgi:hypothetical protein
MKKSNAIGLAEFQKPAEPKQKRMPGMENDPIKDLEEAAIEHSDRLGEIRETREEMKRIDERITTIMRREKIKVYSRNGIVLKLRPGRENVSVKVKRHEAEEGE